MERRTVIQLLGISALAVAGAAACSSTPTTGGAAPSVGASASSGPAAVKIPLADIPVGGGVIRAEEKIVATQATAGQYKAFSAVCQHQGCTVGSIEGQKIVCPCHGSAYSIVDGSVVNGPTTRPLIKKASTVEGSDLVIS
ncbi:MAG TPA: Rieske (2Fe-2S) protein [Propionibacteriaceae bacterium]|nr:Rieske (2Fe-2S) protein [Propionibacteriaceae bacterium]